ncbi:hypothetical protein [Methylobacterium sp. J-070]|uniref:hypothetical protein n=1 Tax=Methylobacterium sp. J-070 TaxID=2836650 RepID=UPI001FBA8151|nr:hypothetical protein [Methylobacterium sp. J-070]MCJ2054196.1 hypothetical protein [Methylobacterium sp. J-070]
MTVRFSGMEHFRSTLATTAIAVLGLVVAARSLHPGNYEVQTPPARPVAVAALPVAWTDPPARIAAPETTGTLRSDLRLSGVQDGLPSAVPAPQQAAVIPPGTRSDPAFAGEISGAAEPARKGVAAYRPKGSERAARHHARLRHAALARTASVERAAAAPAAGPAQAPPASSARIDPIGDILRGLGFGRDG